MLKYFAMPEKYILEHPKLKLYISLSS